MPNGVSKPAKLAKRLNARHLVLGSWRKVAEEFRSPLIKAGTLDRIAKSGGAWLPKRKSILEALGLYKPHRIKRIFDMSSAELLWRLNNRIKM